VERKVCRALGVQVTHLGIDALVIVQEAVRIELLLGQQRVVVVPLQQGDHHVRRPLMTTTKSVLVR
jgi:hypothetical protein